jgi:uncharacterized protein YceK
MLVAAAKVTIGLALVVTATAKGCGTINADGTYGDGEYPVGYSIAAGTYKAISGNGCRVVVERQHSARTSVTRRFTISVDDDNVKLSGGCRWKQVK